MITPTTAFVSGLLLGGFAVYLFHRGEMHLLQEKVDQLEETVDSLAGERNG